MVCAEDVVSYFQSLRSYERIWIMCRLQHSCLPFELRFLGTCLEELGKKDFHELRQAENEANSTAEINTSDLHKISNRHVRKKIILYLSLLYSHNYSCSNSLYKILCNSDEVNSILRCDALDNEEDSVEHLLMIYTLAVNHPAFSFEQKRVLHSIFTVVQAEDNKRTNAKRKFTPVSGVNSKTAFIECEPSLKECQPPISTSPETTFPSELMSNPSHPYPPPFVPDIPIALPTANIIRYPYPGATSPQLYGPWNPAMSIVFAPNDHTNTTHTFMSRSSSPSISNTPSRSSSPSAKGRPLSAPFPRSPQMSGALPHQPASLPLPQTTVDPFSEIKDSPNLPINPVANFTPEELYRMTNEDLAAYGLKDDSIQQFRCVADKVLPNNDDSSPTNSTDKTLQYIETEPEEVAFIKQPIPPRAYHTEIMVNPAAQNATCSPSHLCHYCLSMSNGNPVNGYVSVAPADMATCMDQFAMMGLGSKAPSRNSSSHSDTTSSEHSPPVTPQLPKTTHGKKSFQNKKNELSDTNANSHSDERANAGDSSSEERNTHRPLSQNRGGRVINNHGRSKNGNSYRGRGNNRRRNENVNGNADESRKSQYPVSNADPGNFNYTSLQVTAAATSAAYMPPFMRSYPVYTAPNGFLRPTYPFTSSGELLYPPYPPPGTFLQPGPIPYSPVVPPKLSCFNCGSQSHFATDCAESTMEEASKQGQYRLDYTPVEEK